MSFSPATLDFGSGLLVLREQCNKMGVCGLHTEKVGLPIEKALTIKNEGTVAVTLTLSASAPYKIVSVLPTLSPGQSGQVTVRFDTNESGSFTGTVQVGINGGQGSVSSSPLVGVAHKIEVAPAGLNFGLIFVGSTREQKLTVKNQGVTTVPLTVSTAAPFSIAFDGSFVLSPGESREVAVQFNPTTSGNTRGSIRLASGTVFKEFPVTGIAYTEDELMAWFERQRQADAEVCQASQDANGTTPAMYIPTEELDAILYGFKCLSEEEFRDTIRFILSGEWEALPSLPSLDPDGAQPFPFNPDIWDAQKVLAAIVWISSQPNPGEAFEQALNGNCPECMSWAPAFQQFVAILRLTDGDIIIGPIKISLGADPLFEGDRGKGVTLALADLLRKNSTLVVTIMGMMATLSQRISSPWGRMYYQGTAFYMIARVWKAAQTMDPMSSYAQAGFTETLAKAFVQAMATLISQPQGSLPEVALWYLGQVILNAGKLPFPLSPSVEQMANATAQVVALGGLANNNWDIRYVGVVSRNRSASRQPAGLDIVATTVIDGRLTAGFIHVEAKLGPQEVDAVAEILSELAFLASNSIARRNFQTEFGVPESADGVAILIAYNSDQDTVNKLVQKLGTPVATVVIVWIDSNNIIHATGICGRSGCPGGKTAQEYANSIAQSLGLQPGQPFENSPLAESGYSADFLITFFSELLQMCAGDVNCAMYHFKWWLWHYSCLNPASSRFQVLDNVPCRP